MICQKCNTSIPDKAVFCPVCGARIEAPASIVRKPDPLPDEDRAVRVRQIEPETAPRIPEDQDRTVRVRQAKPEPVTHTPPEEVWQEEPAKPRYMINFISLALLVICLALWVLLPFMAVNNYTLADQPTALALLLDDVDYVGELTDALAYWMAIVAVGGLVLCLACVVLKSRIVTRVLAAIALVPFVVTIVNVASWAADLADFFDFFGIAFWGILAGLLAVAVLGGGWRKRK